MQQAFDDMRLVIKLQGRGEGEFPALEYKFALQGHSTSPFPGRRF